MDVSRLPENCKYENGMLRGPRPGTLWSIDGVIWQAWETRRINRQHAEVTVCIMTGPDATIESRFSVSQFWGLVSSGRLYFLRPITGDDAVRAGIQSY